MEISIQDTPNTAFDMNTKLAHDDTASAKQHNPFTSFFSWFFDIAKDILKVSIALVNNVFATFFDIIVGIIHMLTYFFKTLSTLALPLTIIGGIMLVKYGIPKVSSPTLNLDNKLLYSLPLPDYVKQFIPISTPAPGNTLVKQLSDQTKTVVTILRSNADPVTFICDTAVSNVKVIKGLQKHSPLGKNECMFFVFQEPTQIPFWTKDMLFNIDILFVTQNLVVTKIFHDIPPCNTEACPAYAPKNKYQFVIEILGGLSKELNIQEGNTITVAVLPHN